MDKRWISKTSSFNYVSLSTYGFGLLNILQHVHGQLVLTIDLGKGSSLLLATHNISQTRAQGCMHN